MKKQTAIFLFFYLMTLFSWPLQALAQTNSTTDDGSGLALQPPDTDLSVQYLGNIFGTVDGVLTGTGGLLGAMFGIFNGAVLTLGGIVILYTLFVSTLNTAHEGEMLGKRWSSIWIPLRSVIGIALLVPKATGYSFIQIFMMWVAVMGVGAADSVWNSALDYFGRGGILIQENVVPGAVPGNGGGAAVVKASQTLLQSLTCMEMLQSQLEKYRTNQIQNQAKIINPSVPNFYQRVTNSLNAQLSSGSGTLSFPTLDATFDEDRFYLKLAGECGSISWNNPTSALNSLDQTNPISYRSQAATVTQSRGLAVSSMIQQLDSLAQTIVSNYQNSNLGQGQPSTNLAPKPLGHIIFPPTGSAGSAPYVWGGGTLQSPLSPLFSSGSMFTDAAAVYFNIMGPTLNLANQGKSLAENQKWINDAKNLGWILAGRFYFDVINLNQKGANLSENDPPTAQPPKTDFINETPPIVSTFFPANSSYVSKLDTVVNLNGAYGVSTKGTTGQNYFMQDALTYGNSLTYGNISGINGGTGSSPNSASNEINQVLGPVLGIGHWIRDGLLNLTSSQSNNLNPIVALAQLGNGLVGTVFATYITVAVVVFTLGFIAMWVPFVGAAILNLIVGLTMILMNLFTPILVPLFVTGLVMTFYLPMVPFIIFLFGAIGWLISVIEAIIAAPLVALGIAHPEGQEILGKAEPAIMLLVNVFLRPTFMIFGFLTGMMISYVGVWLLNQGFGLAFQNASGQATEVVSGLFGPYAYLVIYVAIVTQVLHRSFALIHIIPDEVLKWIGGNVKGMGGEAEAESKTAGAAQGAADAASKPVSSAPKGATGINKAIGGAKGEISGGGEEGKTSSNPSLQETSKETPSSATQAGGNASAAQSPTAAAKAVGS